MVIFFQNQTYKLVDNKAVLGKTRPENAHDKENVAE